MHGPLDHILSGRDFPELVVLTTDSGSGAVTGAVSLGENWDHLLRDLVIDAGRQARSGPTPDGFKSVDRAPGLVARLGDALA